MISIFDGLYKNKNSLHRVLEQFTNSFGFTGYQSVADGIQFGMDSSIGGNKYKFTLRLGYDTPEKWFPQLTFSLDLETGSEVKTIIDNFSIDCPCAEWDEVKRQFWIANANTLKYMFEKAIGPAALEDCRDWFVSLDEDRFTNALYKLVTQIAVKDRENPENYR